MNRLFNLSVLLAALCFGLLGSASRLRAAEPHDLYKKSINGVVWIENHVEQKGKTATFMGSGFLVDAGRRLVVTNYHVAMDEETMDVYFPVRDAKGQLIGNPEYYRKNRESLEKTGHYSGGRVVARAPEKDLVVVQLNALPDSAIELKLATTPPSSSDMLHMLGNPAGRDLWRWGPAVKPKLGAFRGKYSNFSQVFDYKQISYSSNSFGGNSGGPVLNDDGLVVGVHSTGGGEGGMNGGAVHFSEVAELLATITTSRVLSISNPTTSTLYYQVRWGDGEWKEHKIEPGRTITHWLTGENVEPQIRFDRSAAAGYQEMWQKLDFFTAHLGRNVEPGPDWDAKQYEFQYDASGQELALYSKN